MPWHAGVLGTGDWCRVHLAALSASPHVDRVTLVGRNVQALGQLAAEFPIVGRTATEPRVVLDDPSVELVHVVLPITSMPRAIEALSAGKHVICEKPAATRLSDFDAMVAAAGAHGRRLLVVMNQLYNPVVWRMRELVDAGAIGRPFLSVENAYRDARRNYDRLDYWRNTPDLAGGGVLIDGGFHMVYRHLYMLAGVGTPDWVLADTPQLAVSPDGTVVPAKGEDFVSITVGYAAGLRIQWAHGWTLAANVVRARQSFLAGTAGTLELTDRPEAPIILHAPVRDTVVDAGTGPHTGVETTHACLLDYLDCLARQREPARATLPLARLTLATILAAYESGQTGKREAVAKVSGI